MNAATVELILGLVEAAGPLIVAGTAAGAQWIANRDEVRGMIDEGRDPTPEEHARLSQELVSLTTALDAAVETAIDEATASDDE